MAMFTAMTIVPGIAGGGVDAVRRSLYKNGVFDRVAGDTDTGWRERIQQIIYICFLRSIVFSNI